MESIQERQPARGLTFEDVWAMFQETDRRFKETDRRFKETDERFKETDERIKETATQIKETDRLLRKNMSDLGRKFGKIIEQMFIPNLKEKFKAFGFVFGKSSPNVLIESPEHDIYTEIDLLMENGGDALAVEIKAQANIDDVREHVERMGKLRRYFDLHDDRRKLYGAVAAAVFPKNVLDFALKQGFYVIEQSGENVYVKKPEGEAKAW